MRKKERILGRMLKMVVPLGGYMVLAILLGSIGYLCAIFVPVLGGYAVLSVLGEPMAITLTVLVVSIIILAVARAFLRYGEQLLNHYIAFKLLARIRDKVFAALRRLSPAKLEGKDKGELISLITTDIELLEVFYAHTISPVAIAIIVSSVMSIIIGIIHPLLGVIAAAGYLIVGMVLPRITSKEGEGLGSAFRTKFGQLNGYFLDSLRGMQQTIQYGNGEERLNEIMEKTEQLGKNQKKLKKIEGNSLARTGTMILTFSAIVLVTSVLLWKNGSIGFSGVFIATIAMTSSFGAVTALANLSNNLLQTFAAGRRVFGLMDEEPAVEEKTNGIEVAFEGAACEDISFSYGEEMILKSFHLQVQKNNIVGMVGKSGSGKSTVLKLLMRFWDANSGKVLLSDQNIQKINTACLRDMQSYMTQDTMLFRDSLLNNILIAKPNATQQEVEEACKKASIHEFILQLPDGYQTNAGELGERLSGGEKQRIGLARAFLHDAPLLLLDEPTSNLDSLNEAVILKALYEGKGEKTVVIVSHRNSTMRIANEVIQVENGRVS